MTAILQFIQQAWAFLIPLVSTFIFSCCVFFAGSLAGLLYSHRQDRKEIFRQKTITYAAIIAVLALDALRALWDAFFAAHFPVEVTDPVMICALLYGGRAAFRLCVLRVQDLSRSVNRVP
jgi:uncharacterized membrane protein